MNTLNAFEFITANGYFKGPGGDISWYVRGPEENEFSREWISKGNTLLFGRVTYEMMVAYWSSPGAKANDPFMANAMNNAEKIVFSRTMQAAEWYNTRLIKNNIAEEVSALKQTGGKNLTILGSGSIVTQLAESGLLDEYQLMINPVIIGAGTPVFQGITKNLRLEHTGTRTFKSGVVLLTYKL